MPQTFLEGGQDRCLITSLDIDDSISGEASLRESRREKIRAGHAPQHLPLGPGRDTRHEQGRGCAMECAVSAARNLMKCAELEAARRQMVVERRDAEGEHPAGRAPARLNPRDLGAQGLEGHRMGQGGHEFQNEESKGMFRICSP